MQLVVCDIHRFGVAHQAEGVRAANGFRQIFEYDRRGQLVAVKEGGADIERYVYDKAGNMTKKTIAGKTTTFTFDGANQLVSSTCDGVTTRYEYDAAGRLVKEGNRTYTYGYLDKVTSVKEGANVYTYDYHVDGQLAKANYGNGIGNGAGNGAAPQSESFLWDGLALIQRGDEQFVNEPHIGGGNPVASSNGTTYFNDALGTTVGAKKGRKYSPAALTAFGEHLNVNAADDSSHSPFPVPHSRFFTGKPEVPGLGYAFFMRNYRAGLAKWQTADPLGYPDGWNALAYCNNGVTSAVDLWGGAVWRLYYNDDYYDYGVEDPNKYELCKTVERNNPGILDAMHRVEELGMHISIKSTVSPDESMNMTSKPITTYFDNGNCMAREWDTWNEQCVTTTYICECSVDSTVKNVSDMLSIISGVFGAISKVCKTVKIGDKIVETASDISTDTGIASSLGSLFDEHKVLFTIDLGSKIEYSRTPFCHHLRLYEKE